MNRWGCIYIPILYIVVPLGHFLFEAVASLKMSEHFISLRVVSTMICSFFFSWLVRYWIHYLTLESLWRYRSERKNDWLWWNFARMCDVSDVLLAVFPSDRSHRNEPNERRLHPLRVFQQHSLDFASHFKRANTNGFSGPPFWNHIRWMTCSNYRQTQLTKNWLKKCGNANAD